MDGDGVRDGGDTPLGGVAFNLFTKAGAPAIDFFGLPVPTVFSDITGKFTFDNLKVGDYLVKENLALSDTFSVDSDNDGIPDKGDGIKDFSDTFLGDTIDQGLRQSSGKAGYEITIEKPGEAKALKDDQQFGNYITGSIHGVKFHDFDGDGVWDKNEKETKLKGIQFDIFKFIKTNTFINFSGKTNKSYTWADWGDATTNVHGEFWFANLDPGLYEVSEKSGIHKDGMEWAVSTGQQQGKVASDFDKIDPFKSASLFEIISRREFVWELGAAGHPDDGLGDGVPGQNADGLLQQGEIDFGKAKAALKKEIIAGATQATIFDSNGFEAAFGYSTTFLGTGTLEGQPAGDHLVWQRTSGANVSQATVQSTVVKDVVRPCCLHAIRAAWIDSACRSPASR
jgi:hypothetical protein